MLYKCANAYYFRSLNKIGGIESHLYYIAKKYSKYDIVVFYQQSDSYQLLRLNQYVRCIQLKSSDQVECDALFCCFNREILDQCKARKTYLVLHGDYLSMIEQKQLNHANLPLDERIDEYIGVSKLVCNNWKKLTGIKAKNVYEPVVLDRNEKPLMFVSATRLTKEKGWEKMKILAEELDKNNVNYLWFIFTDSPQKPTSNMVFVKPRLDITSKLEMFDAFIQLSDNEGYCLSVVEALIKKVPVIATDLPVFKELGLNDQNSVIIKNFEKIPINDIKNIYKKKFIYKQPQDLWEKVLVKTKNKYKGRRGVMRIKALINYFDTFEKKDISVGEVYETTDERANMIIAYKYAETVDEPKVEEKKNEPKAEERKDESKPKGKLKTKKAKS